MQRVDFPPAIAYGYISIFYARVAAHPNSDIISDAFDLWSYLAILLIWILSVAVMYSAIPNMTVGETFVSAFGNRFSQVIIKDTGQ